MRGRGGLARPIGRSLRLPGGSCAGQAAPAPPRQYPVPPTRPSLGQVVGAAVVGAAVVPAVVGGAVVGAAVVGGAVVGGAVVGGAVVGGAVVGGAVVGGAVVGGAVVGGAVVGGAVVGGAVVGGPVVGGGLVPGGPVVGGGLVPGGAGTPATPVGPAGGVVSAVEIGLMDWMSPPTPVTTGRFPPVGVGGWEEAADPGGLAPLPP